MSSWSLDPLLKENESRHQNETAVNVGIKSWSPHPNLFTHKPHTLVGEEKANLFARITYRFVNHIIMDAAKGKLPTGIVAPLCLADKCTTNSSVLYDHYSRERASRHRWDMFIND
eukprot:Tbor_TRINITY_DN8011_c0_g1::TRINITY_DN8011_c0_g1_i1::g.17612::m.17612